MSGTHISDLSAQVSMARNLWVQRCKEFETWLAERTTERAQGTLTTAQWEAGLTKQRTQLELAKMDYDDAWLRRSDQMHAEHLAASDIEQRRMGRITAWIAAATIASGIGVLLQVARD